MRADITVGSAFPDYELPDHTGTPRRLSELQGEDPIIIVLAREAYSPRTSGNRKDWPSCGGR